MQLTSMPEYPACFLNSARVMDRWGFESPLGYVTTDWPARWIDLARHIAGWSKDRSTKVGCVVVGDANQILAAGYNGFPRGVNDDVDQRHERPEKYLWTEHAERNAIYHAARHGVRLQGAIMFLPWFPCADCARAIIQAGLSAVVVVEPDWDSPVWKDSFEVTRIMLDEAGVEVKVSPPC
jgi:dCMP deaminase